MDNKRYAVAIDGPSGAGKSTLAKAAAAELGILYVDTGPSTAPSACTPAAGRQTRMIWRPSSPCCRTFR